RRDFRQGHDEILGKRAAAPIEQPSEEEIEGSEAAPLQFLAERLDANADPGRERAAGGCRGDFVCSGAREAIFFLVSPIAKSVFEVDPKILDRLALQFVHHTR